MYLLAKASPLVLLIGGGSCIPYLLNSNHFVNPETSSSVVSNSTPEEQNRSLASVSGTSTLRSSSDTQHSEPPLKNPENCTVEEESEVSRWLPITIKHVFFSCNNGGRGDEVLNANWKIWIPLELLNGAKDSFTKGKKVDIKTETRSLSENAFGSLTKFESQSFTNLVINGEWGTSLLEDSSEVVVEPQVYKVRIINSNSEDKMMYLSQD